MNRWLTEKTVCWGILGALLSAPFSVIANGAVLVKLWGWFIVPIFELDPLRLVEAMGVSIVAAKLTYQNVAASDWGVPLWVSAWFVALIQPVSFLVIGWAVSLFM